MQLVLTHGDRYTLHQRAAHSHNAVTCARAYAAACSVRKHARAQRNQHKCRAGLLHPRTFIRAEAAFGSDDEAERVGHGHPPTALLEGRRALPLVQHEHGMGQALERLRPIGQDAHFGQTAAAGEFRFLPCDGSPTRSRAPVAWQAPAGRPTARSARTESPARLPAHTAESPSPPSPRAPATVGP
jgi:hypothetical protein